jgi:hypothetical protein
MALDPVALVLVDLNPVLTLDPTLQDAIPVRIAAEMAIQGWATGDTTDQQNVYIATLVTRVLVSRLLLQFSQAIKQTEGGAAKVVFVEAIKYLEALKESLDQRRLEEAFIANPQSMITFDKWPGCGVSSF